MSNQDNSIDPWDLDNPSTEQMLADDNLQAQEALWDSLAKARQEASRTIEEVAEKLGLPVDLVHAIEGGRVNISLSDLREYAYAIDALVTYRVASRFSEKVEDHSRSLSPKDGKWFPVEESKQDVWSPQAVRKMAKRSVRASA